MRITIPPPAQKKPSNIDKLLVNREKEAKEIAKILALKPREIYVYRSSDINSYSFSYRDQGNYPGGYKSQRFKTVIDKLYASYFEDWIKDFDQINNRNFYYLNKAYLHLYLLNEQAQAEQEFMLLHCDPNEPDTEPHARYKQSIHIHVACNDAPSPHKHIWPHAHLALNVEMLDTTLQSTHSLTQSLKNAIEMVKDEVIPRFTNKKVFF